MIRSACCLLPASLLYPSWASLLVKDLLKQDQLRASPGKGKE